MQICDKCGNQCFDNERYCSECDEQIQNRKPLQCDYCGSVAADLKSNVCPSCGARLTFDLITFSDRLNNCLCCGEKLAPEAKFCGMCGARTEFGERERAERNERIRGRRVTATALSIIGIVVLGLSVAFAMVIHDRRISQESGEGRRSSYAERSESESRQEAEWAEAAKTAEYTKYTAQ